MKKYCAFLRGVNVKGTNMKMTDVCKVFADAGMKNVSSVLASGNILFQSNKNADDLKNILGKKFLKDKITSRNLNTFEKIMKRMG
jgi:uncharacterized protein (DUF1697 family)